MWLQILNRTKQLLNITDTSQDEQLLYLIEGAVLQIQEYIHDTNIIGLEPFVALLAAHNMESGEGTGEGSSSAGGITPQLGEVKEESYSGVTYKYTTTADFAGKSSSSSSSSSNTGGQPNTYFMNMIAPFLKGRRRIQTIKAPMGYRADDTIR